MTIIIPCQEDVRNELEFMENIRYRQVIRHTLRIDLDNFIKYLYTYCIMIFTYYIKYEDKVAIRIMNITTSEALEQALSHAKTARTDYSSLELKTGKEGFPESARTMSAFANTHGGTIVYGITESTFEPVSGIDIKRIQTGCAQTARELIVPPLAPDIRIIEHHGAPIVIANIDEVDHALKPVYVRKEGERNGSYLRIGDGDHHLSGYEVDRLKENAEGKATNDKLIVGDATLEDLDSESMALWLGRIRQTSDKRVADLDDEILLLARGVVVKDEFGLLRPTIAGLMCFGRYPQAFFPMLRVTFAQYSYDVSWSDAHSEANVLNGADEIRSTQERYRRKTNIEGTIPDMVAGTLTELSDAMSHRGILVGSVMTDVPEYPLTAIREGIANALIHRDYSSGGLSTPVRIELRPNSLTIRNPGGLFGDMTIDQLGFGGTAYRNQFVARILEDAVYREGGVEGTVVEALGSGFRVIRNDLRQAGLGAPLVNSTLSEFVLRMNGPRVSASRQNRTHGRIGKQATVDRVLTYLSEHGATNSKTLSDALGIGRQTILRYLNRLIEDDVVERIGLSRSPQQAYRLKQ